MSEKTPGFGAPERMGDWTAPKPEEQQAPKEDTEKPRDISRRDFVKGGLVAVGALVLGGMAASKTGRETIRKGIDKVEEYNEQQRKLTVQENLKKYASIIEMDEKTISENFADNPAKMQEQLQFYRKQTELHDGIPFGWDQEAADNYLREHPAE
jgi:hypothetical protein